MSVGDSHADHAQCVERLEGGGQAGIRCSFQRKRSV